MRYFTWEVGTIDIGSAAILVGFHPGLEIFVIIMAKYESSIWVTWRESKQEEGYRNKFDWFVLTCDPIIY